MAATKLADVIVPEVFNPYVVERTAEKTALIQSGVIQPVSDIQIGEGTTINLPFFQDLSGADNLWVDTVDISLNKIDTEKDVAVVLTREKAFGASDLSASLSGSDPMAAIGSLIGGYWARRNQVTLINTLNGAMAAFNDNTLDISGLGGATGDFDGESFIDAKQKLGDRSDSITDVAVHSATAAALGVLDLIDFIPDSEGKLTIRSFQGSRVHIDDNMPVTSGAYTSYLFGQGAVSFVDEMQPNANEAYRHPDKNGGTDALYTRRKFVMHPRGVAWTGTAAAATPTNAELATSGNWARRWEAKNIRIVRFVHTNS
jgi:hypothetical protein